MNTFVKYSMEGLVLLQRVSEFDVKSEASIKLRIQIQISKDEDERILEILTYNEINDKQWIIFQRSSFISENYEIGLLIVRDPITFSYILYKCKIVLSSWECFSEDFVEFVRLFEA
jgi:hypothetical protein